MEVTLRLPILADAQTILAWENNPENWEVSDNDSPYSIEDIETLVQSFYGAERPSQLRFMICLGDHLLGAVDIFDINYEFKSGSIGILIAQDEFRRKGYASRALERVEEEAKKLGIFQLKAVIHTNNRGSRNLFEKAGYTMTFNDKNEHTNNSIEVEKWVGKEL